MGEFEDLIQKAKTGDQSALDELSTKFSASSLRKEAEEAAKLRQTLKEQMPLIREAKLRQVKDQLPDSMKAVELSLSDLGEVDPSEITVDLVKERVEAKLIEAKTARERLAKDQGFDSVEEFEQALESAKQAQTTKKKAMEAIGGATASSSGSSKESESSPAKAMFTAFEAAKKDRKAEDFAMGEGMEALLTAQAPVEE